eukprot:8967452-Pyramimonas_sp.AAC.1
MVCPALNTAATRATTPGAAADLMPVPRRATSTGSVRALWQTCCLDEFSARTLSDAHNIVRSTIRAYICY